MTDEQKQRISAALAELESAVSDAGLPGEIWIDFRPKEVTCVDDREKRFVYEIVMHVANTTVFQPDREEKA